MSLMSFIAHLDLDLMLEIDDFRLDSCDVRSTDPLDFWGLALKRVIIMITHKNIYM